MINKEKKKEGNWRREVKINRRRKKKGNGREGCRYWKGGRILLRWKGGINSRWKK